MNKSIILSGFADESANEKTVDQQLSVLAALGMQYFSLRFIDVGSGIKNVMQLDDRDIALLKQKLEEYQIKVSSIGSPIGKVKLLDKDDGTNNQYRPFDDYLQNEVERACELATVFETQLIRGFSFYPPRESHPKPYVDEVVERTARIAALCDRHGLTFGLEVEANLVGRSGELLAEIHKRVDHPALVLVFDGGNLVTQGFSTEEVFEQYQAMKPGLGWLHIKDFRNPEQTTRQAHIDEDALRNFVPPDQGEVGHADILADLVDFLPELNQRMAARGVPGTFVDLEPHLKGGGQFGGFSGPDGFGIAMRSFCRLCDRAGIEYQLRDAVGAVDR